MSSRSSGIVLDMPLSVNTVSLPTAYDLSRNGNTGTVTAATLAADGRSMVFDGTSANIDLGDVLDFHKSGATYSFWCRNTVDRYSMIIGKHRYQADSFLLYMASRRPGLFFKTSGTTHIESGFGGAALALNTWYHIAVTLDRSANALCYVNGVIYGNPLDISGGDGDDFNATATTFQIGAMTNAGNFWFPGNIAQVHNWSHLRTPGQIKNEYEATRNLFGV